MLRGNDKVYSTVLDGSLPSQDRLLIFVPSSAVVAISVTTVPNVPRGYVVCTSGASPSTRGCPQT